MLRRRAVRQPKGRSTIEPEPFSITRSTLDEPRSSTLVGELDMANADAVAETLDELARNWQRGRRRPRDLSFIDSSGIHALLRPRPYEARSSWCARPGTSGACSR